MCILRYLPAMLPSASSTTAVLWYRPVARFSNSELTRTTPCCLASAESRPVLGPGIVSARSNSSTDSCWQKYDPLCSSCSTTSFAPWRAASPTRASITSRFSAAPPWLRSWTRATGSVLVFFIECRPAAVFRGPAIVGRRCCPLDEAGRQLHGNAVQAAVLPDQSAAGHLHHFATRMGFGQHCGGEVVGRVVIGGHQHGAVDHQVVGVAGGEPAPAVEHRLRPGQRKHPVGASVDGAQRGELGRHRREFGVVRVGGALACL